MDKADRRNLCSSDTRATVLESCTAPPLHWKARGLGRLSRPREAMAGQVVFVAF